MIAPRVVLKLAFSNLAAHKVRLALAAAAVALSVSLVVSVTSGYASTAAAAEQFLGRFIGTVDAEVTRQNDNRGAISTKIVDDIAADPDVERITSRLETELALAPPPPTTGQTALVARPAQVSGIRRPQDKRAKTIFKDESRTWLWVYFPFEA